MCIRDSVVPVGRDQLPHIELTRTIARRFNNRYGKVFPEVDALLSETPLLPGLDGRKMSKSYGNAINISMTAEETAKRIKKSQTDSERMITFDPEGRPGVSGLLSTAAICTGRAPEAVSYTHLTLPTNREVEVSVGASALVRSSDEQGGWIGEATIRSEM